MKLKHLAATIAVTASAFSLSANAQALPTLPSLPVGSIPALPNLGNLASVPNLGGLTSVPSLGALPGLGSIPSLPSLGGGVPSLPGLGSLPSLPGLGKAGKLPAIPGINTGIPVLEAGLRKQFGVVEFSNLMTTVFQMIPEPPAALPGGIPFVTFDPVDLGASFIDPVLKKGLPGVPVAGSYFKTVFVKGDFTSTLNALAKGQSPVAIPVVGNDPIGFALSTGSGLAILNGGALPKLPGLPSL